MLHLLSARVLNFLWSNNGYVGFYKIIFFNMFMQDLVGFIRLFLYHKIIKRNYSINCLFFTKLLWFILLSGGHEYQNILMQEWLVWVEVECTYLVVWSILWSTMEDLGKILVASSANAQNRYRMCTIWIKTLKRLNFLQITSSDMPHMYFQA